MYKHKLLPKTHITYNKKIDKLKEIYHKAQSIF